MRFLFWLRSYSEHFLFFIFGTRIAESLCCHLKIHWFGRRTIISVVCDVYRVCNAFTRFALGSWKRKSICNDWRLVNYAPLQLRLITAFKRVSTFLFHFILSFFGFISKNECISITENSLHMRAVVKWCWFDASNIKYKWRKLYHVLGVQQKHQQYIGRHWQTHFDTKSFSCINLVSMRFCFINFGRSHKTKIKVEMREERKIKINASCVYYTILSPIFIHYNLQDTCNRFINLFLYIFMRCKYSTNMYFGCL